MGIDAAMVQEKARVAAQPRNGGSRPTSPLLKPYRPRDLSVIPVPNLVARQMCERSHYLRSYPGGSFINFGIIVGDKFLGVAVLAAGPANLRRLFQGAEPREVVCLSRFWLDDRLGPNSESRALGIIVRSLKRWQSTVKAVVGYSDPAAGHTGCIYRGAGFLFLGESEAMPRYRLPDGSLHHSRSLSHNFGTHSLRHFRAHGVEVERVPQARKLIYVALVDPTWGERLTRPILPYPKFHDREDPNGRHHSAPGPTEEVDLEPQ